MSNPRMVLVSEDLLTEVVVALEGTEFQENIDLAYELSKARDQPSADTPEDCDDPEPHGGGHCGLPAGHEGMHRTVSSDTFWKLK